MLALRFHKMHGAGNDFVLFDGLQNHFSPDIDWARIAPVYCIRRLGVGADGVILLERSRHANLRMRMWNPDGSEDMCGNGLRCLAALAWRQDHLSNSRFTVQTLAGIRGVERTTDGEFHCDMGTPTFAPDAVPTNAQNPLVEFDLAIDNRVFSGATCVSTGSTHTVIFLDSPLSDADFEFFAPKIEHHALFPQRTSVMFAMAKRPEHFEIRIWERGAGETLACGTGACAVAASAWKTGRARGKVEVQSRGGTLMVRETEGKIWLSGPTQHLFEGEFLFST